MLTPKTSRCTFSCTQFWSIVDRAEFVTKFCKSGHHPLIRENGGYEFYNQTNLQRRIDITLQKLEEAKDPKNSWLLTNSLRTYRSWLVQACWIERKIACLE